MKVMLFDHKYLQTGSNTAVWIIINLIDLAVCTFINDSGRVLVQGVELPVMSGSRFLLHFIFALGTELFYFLSEWLLPSQQMK